MARVVWTAPAREDLVAIRRFVARESPSLAARLNNRIVAATRRLTTFPASGRIVPETDRDDVREVIVGAYRVIDRLRGSEARIIMVHHAARLLDKRELDARS